MAGEAPKDNSKESSQFESFKRKVKDFQASPKVGNLKRFLSHHVREVVSGSLVFFGIIVDFFNYSSGFFIASGAVLAFYPEICSVLSNLQVYYAKNGPARNTVLFGLLFFLFIKVPSFAFSFLILCVILALLSSNKPTNVDE